MHTHICLGADVRLCIRHFILWEDGSPSPVELSIPSASTIQMQQVKSKCQRSDEQTVQVKTRLQNECQGCVNLRSKLHRVTQEHKQQVTQECQKHQEKETALKHDISRLKERIKNLEEELAKEKQESIRARGGRHIDVNRSVIGALLSGIQYWQFQRFFQITGTLGLCSKKKWDELVVKVYHGVNKVVTWQQKDLIITDKPISCCGDCRWSHVGHHARHGTALIIDVERDVVIAWCNISKDENIYDKLMQAWKESSGAMECEGLKICFKKLKENGYKIKYCSFDGDSEARKAFFSYFPYGFAVRDPSHIGKNSGNMMIRVNKTYKYNCECEYQKTVKGEKKKIVVASLYVRIIASVSNVRNLSRLGYPAS